MIRINALCHLLVKLLLLLPALASAQNAFRLRQSERELNEIFTVISQAETDSARLSLSIDFRKHLMIALNIPGSGSYPWDSLKNLAKIESPDKSFRLYNWNVPLTNGCNSYFCLIQWKGDLKKKSPVTLTDYSDSIKAAEYMRGDSLHWYGALYYRIIPFEMNHRKTAYLLLGWNGISNEISGKIIEVLTFDNTGAPVFGAAVFSGYHDAKIMRIIFRFSSASPMSLRYLEQTLRGKKLPMIVFDHLMPMDPNLEKQYQFYVPSSETAEGFAYENYTWKYVPEFDSRNP